MRLLPEPLRFARGLALAALVAVSLGGCSDNDTAIFYYIENEEPVVDYSLSNEATILGFGSAGGLYFASLGGSIWQRDAAGTTWFRVSLPSGTAFCGPLVVFGPNLYVSLLVGSTWALWSGTAAAQPVWTQVTDGDIDGKQITGLFVAGPGGSERLFAAVQVAVNDHALFSSPDGSNNSIVATGISGKSKPVTQVAWDGTEYYAAVGAELLRGAFGAITTTVTPVAAGGAIITGVYYSPGYAKYFAATDSGLILASADGSDWSESSGEIDVSGTTVRFTRIAEAGAPSGNVLVGTMEHGLYQLTSGDVTANARLADTTDTELYNGWVRDVYIDPVDPTLTFALTSGSGLWHTTYTAPEFADWVRE